MILSDEIYVCRENCGDKQEAFLKRCFYHAGQYSSEDSFRELSKKLHEHEVCVPFEVYFGFFFILQARDSPMLLSSRGRSVNLVLNS